MFFISLLFIIVSSYFLTSIINKHDENKNTSFVYFLLITFAQIILTFELLSLISQINEKHFICTNIICLIISAFLWIKNKKPIFKLYLIEELQKIIKALKKDKLLYFTGICFIVFLIFELLSIYLFPVTHGDALIYNLTRCTAWIQNGNINHFTTPDTRELIMPVNMEFLYTWYLLFFKTEKGIAIFSFCSFLSALYVIYSFLGEAGFCRRKRLWSIFVVSSFLLIGIMTYTPFSDILVGALLLAGIYLFYVNCKTKNNIPLYFSTLSIAIAIGTKTTAIMSLPAICLLFIFLVYKYKNYQAISKYFLLGFLNFIIFSSYNYILNFINYGNPVTTHQQYLMHQFRGGIGGYLTNLFKYCYLIFDISGLKNVEFYNKFLMITEEKILNIFGLNLYSYTSPYFNPIYIFSSKISSTSSVLGAMGLFAFLPSIFSAIKKGIKQNKSIIISLAFVLIINLLVYSKAMIYAKFNTRYLMTFVIISAPILVFSYIKSNKNIYKWFLTFLLFTYLVVIPHKPVIATFLVFNQFNTQSESIFNYIKTNYDENKIYSYLKDKNPNKIALIAQNQNHLIYHIAKLRLNKINVERPTIEKIDSYNLKQYDYIVTTKAPIISANLIKENKSEVVVCSYKDKNQNTTTKEQEVVMTSCISPLEYFKANNFEIITDLKTEKYIILKNKDNK